MGGLVFLQCIQKAYSFYYQCQLFFLILRFRTYVLANHTEKLLINIFYDDIWDHWDLCKEACDLSECIRTTVVACQEFKLIISYWMATYFW